jgi:uncharacterized damage-inducible protein DinB
LGRHLERPASCNWRMPSSKPEDLPFESFARVDEAVPSLTTIINNLARAQGELLRAADAIPAEQWKTRPAEGRWSAGELIAHLSATERTIIGRADKLLQKPPKSVPFYRRFHVPMIVVEARVIRRKAPTVVEPQMVSEKEDMLAVLRGARERTLAFIEETKCRDLSKYNMPHPFLGTLNAYDWLQFIASHEMRHMKQMREIAESLPKTVTSLDK